MTATDAPATRRPAPGPVDRLDALLGTLVATRSIAVVRILVGLVAARHLAPIAWDALHGDTFHDRFHDPFLDAPIVPPAVFAGLMVIGATAAVALSLGALTRVAAVATTTAVGYHLLVATIHLHNNRAYLFAVLLGLSLAPCGRSWSVDRRWDRRRGRARPETMAAWPLWLLRFECSLVYAASGVSKLIDPDWFGGRVTWGRVVTNEAMLRASALPDVVQDLLLDRSFHSVAAKAVVLTELGIAIGLWWRRSRGWAVATAVVFHVMIELGAAVQGFSYLAVAVLFVWADPALASPAVLRPFRRVTA